MIRLAIPDKRYTFDNFKEITTTRTAIDTHVYRNNSNTHSLGTIVTSNLRGVLVESDSSYIPNSAYCYMYNKLYLPGSRTSDQMERLKNIVNNYDEDKYIDAHSWIVTPKSFEIMMYELNYLGYIDLVIDKLYSAPRSLEFLVQLKKGIITSDDCNKRKELYLQRKAEQLEEFEDAIEIKRFLDALDLKTKIFIYGTGGGINRILNYLKGIQIDYDAHVVSDGYKTENDCNGHPVVELSEISELEDIVVLIGVEKYKDNILPQLDARKISYFFA